MSDRYMALIEEAYESRPGDPNWNPEADLNNDGVVDYIDFGIVGAMMEPETIPGDEDGDYPVVGKDATTIFKTFALAAVLAYVVTKIIWR